MDKFCLKWNDFDTNIREYFGKLRDDQISYDVTLVTDDGQQIQAHKLILSAGSQFFNDILIRSDNNNLFIYLQGIRSDLIKHVTDFIYNGEVFIKQEELEEVLETGKELKVNGLMGEIQVVQRFMQEDQDSYEKNIRNIEDRTLDSATEISTSFTTYNAPKLNMKSFSYQELDNQIEEFIEINDGLWKCKVCGKTTQGQKQCMQNHAETHIKGITLACHICSKNYTTRQGLKMHISRTHSESFSCDICGKTTQGLKQSMQNHAETHIKGITHACHICSKNYTTR